MSRKESEMVGIEFGIERQTGTERKLIKRGFRKFSKALKECSNMNFYATNGTRYFVVNVSR